MFLNSSVLVIETERESLRQLQVELLAIGCVVTSVSQIRRLQKTMRSMYRIDLVILGCEMPSPQGQQALQLLRDHRVDVPLIVHTSRADYVSEMARGGMDLILKPIDPCSLRHAVQRILQSPRGWAQR